MNALILAALALCPIEIDLDRISVERARAMSGRIVAASFVVAKPSYTLRGSTVTGAADRNDQAERNAVLKGRRLDVKEGERIVVVGRLRVIDHPPAVVGRVPVAAWVELRVAE